ncbi:MAG: hypothetical protein QG574_107 [Cyanobacteriota bacterium erpe_2018_sw_21hr_WHONDRS-SW48-000092_B_bin.40]|jgi:hypothetical protein|nr:hypothetical protein [Cyanobacteriota bacterium erpe_2018_sw_21hr_WHONDRS-SW48-000092_B_bin.40]
MKTILGIFGAVIGTVALLALVNLVCYGADANYVGIIPISAILGLLNGGYIAVAMTNKSFVDSPRGHFILGATGMAVIFVVTMTMLCLTFGMVFSMPSLTELVTKLVLMSAIGGISGLCYRALASLR